MTDEMKSMMLNDEALEGVDGGDCTIEIDGKKILCKLYRVQKGDTLTKIAQRYNTNVKAIMAVNKGKITDPNKIEVGWIIKVPVNVKL